MNIQSLSVVVPNKSCINNCKFCVSRMRNDDYPVLMSEDREDFGFHFDEFKKRMEFARDNGCNTVMLTGTSEPQQNRRFLDKFATINNSLKSPFKWIEMQTTGVLLDDDYLKFLRFKVGVSTISLSLSALDNNINADYNGTAPKNKVDIDGLCRMIKDNGFNLRLSLNLTDFYNYLTPIRVDHLFYQIQHIYNADQVTFRTLYSSKGISPQNDWIAEHKSQSHVIELITKYIKLNGVALERLPFGAIKYSVDGLSTVIDDDCMAKELTADYKYLVLRPNCKLYSKWDDKGSLIF